MIPSECGDLIRACGFFDNRKLTDEAMIAWSHAIDGEVTKRDALQAIADHHAQSTEYCLPAHINHRVQAMRKERLDRAGTPPMPGDLTWKQEKTWRKLWCDNVKDGMSIEQAAEAASDEMDIPKELPPSTSQSVADERKALVAKLADSKAAPKARPEDLKPKKRKPRTRWGSWSRGDVVPATPDTDEYIAFHPGGRVLYHDLGPYGIPIDGLSGDLKFWLHHIAGKGWGDSATLTQLARAWAHITDASDDEYAQAIVWVSEAIDQEREDETYPKEDL